MFLTFKTEKFVIDFLVVPFFKPTRVACFDKCAQKK